MNSLDLERHKRALALTKRRADVLEGKLAELKKVVLELWVRSFRSNDGSLWDSLKNQVDRPASEGCLNCDINEPLNGGYCEGCTCCNCTANGSMNSAGWCEECEKELGHG